MITIAEGFLIGWASLTTYLAVYYWYKYRKCHREERSRVVRNIIRDMKKTEAEN